MDVTGGTATSSHDARVAAEIEHFRGQVDIHALPDIFHYWSNKYLAAQVADVFDTPDMGAVFSSELAKSVAATGCPDIVSIGAGDGVMEIGIAQRMLGEGVTDFRFECLELSPHLIERGREAARAKGLERHVTFEQVDLSFWNPQRRYGAAFAHHSLHHIVALEHVFDELKRALLPGGAFVIADMIGRNGHMRWPESLAPLERLWSVIPTHYKYHHLFGRQMDAYLNWDCSGEGFEGIRAQDIMPTLVDRFAFRKMCVWGGMLDVFIDRAFGHNLDAKSATDREFIDRVWEADCALLKAGAATPTQVLAVLSGEPGPLRSSWGLSPVACIRHPD